MAFTYHQVASSEFAKQVDERVIVCIFLVNPSQAYPTVSCRHHRNGEITESQGGNFPDRSPFVNFVIPMIIHPVPFSLPLMTSPNIIPKIVHPSLPR